MSLYSDKGERESYFIFNTFLASLVFVIILLITVFGFRAGHQTGDNVNKTSVACVKAGGSWLYNDNSSKWECKNNYTKTEVVQ